MRSSAPASRFSSASASASARMLSSLAFAALSQARAQPSEQNVPPVGLSGSPQWPQWPSAACACAKPSTSRIFVRTLVLVCSRTARRLESSLSSSAAVCLTSFVRGWATRAWSSKVLTIASASSRGTGVRIGSPLLLRSRSRTHRVPTRRESVRFNHSTGRGKCKKFSR